MWIGLNVPGKIQIDIAVFYYEKGLISTPNDTKKKPNSFESGAKIVSWGILLSKIDKLVYWFVREINVTRDFISIAKSLISFIRT